MSFISMQNQIWYFVTRKIVMHGDKFEASDMGKQNLVTQGLLDRVFHFHVQQRDYRYVFDDNEFRSIFMYPPPSDKGLSSAKRLSFYDWVLHFIITHII